MGADLSNSSRTPNLWFFMPQRQMRLLIRFRLHLSHNLRNSFPKSLLLVSFFFMHYFQKPRPYCHLSGGQEVSEE